MTTLAKEPTLGRRLAVRLKGGLGNQLFQWALAVRLRSDGHDVWLDPSALTRGRSIEIGSLQEIPQSTWPSRGFHWAERLGIPWTASGYRIVKEPTFRFSPDLITRASAGQLWDGYWQSPQYFAPVSAFVRMKICALGARQLTSAGRRMETQLLAKAQQTASVHVRRGDYAHNPVARAYHGLLGVGYYRHAMQMLREVGFSQFAVFSDDLAWVHAHLSSDSGVTIVTREVAAGPAADLRLMSACGGHVLANSSFSWWGACLSSLSTPTVVPSKWFAVPVDTSDLLASEWLRAPVSSSP